MPVKINSARAWQRMLSGRRLDLLNPSPLDIEIEDIAQGLSHVARWNGQTHGDHAFSVAQHSLLVEFIVGLLGPITPQTSLAALLHDGAEYVIGDLISPFKAHMSKDYKEVEDKLLQAIFLRFSLSFPMTTTTRKNIKQADKAAAHLEAVYLAGFAKKEAGKLFTLSKSTQFIESILVDEPDIDDQQITTMLHSADGLSPSKRIQLLLKPWPATIVKDVFLRRFKALHDEVKHVILNKKRSKIT